MSCLKCKKIIDQKTSYQCDLCQKHVCNECSALTSTEERCMGLSKQRRLKFFCPECDKSTLVFAKCIQSNQKLLQENQQLLKQLLEVQTKTNNMEGTIKKFQKEMQADLTETIQKLIKKEIIEVKEEINNLKESNKDLVKLFSDAPSITTTKPTPLFKDIVKQQNREQKNSINKWKENIPSNQQNKPKNKPTTPTSNTLEPHIRTTIRTNESIPLEQSTQKSTNDAWTEVSQKVASKKARRKKQIGTAETHADANLKYGFEGRQESPKNKKLWIFLSKAKDNVTEDLVKKYISEKSNTDVNDISVKQIKTYHQIKDNNCFLVGVDLNLIDIVYDEKFWPRGIAFDRFNFYRGRQFLDNAQKENQSSQRTSEHFLSPIK